MSKKLSQAQNRKRKSNENRLIDSLRNSILNFVQTPTLPTSLCTIGDNPSPVETITANYQSQNDLATFDSQNVEFIEDKDDNTKLNKSFNLENSFESENKRFHCQVWSTSS